MYAMMKMIIVNGGVCFMKITKKRVQAALFLSLLLAVCVSCTTSSTKQTVSLFHKKEFDVGATREGGSSITMVDMEHETYQFVDKQESVHVQLQFTVDTKKDLVIKNGFLIIDGNEALVYSTNDEKINVQDKKQFEDILADVGISEDEVLELVLELANSFT